MAFDDLFADEFFVANGALEISASFGVDIFYVLI